MRLSLFRNHRKGETILETVIAMGILAVGISLASTIVGSSLRSINASKNRIIAISIAREGLEAIRNIRDTNWLKFNSTRRECWNHMPVAGVDTCVNANDPIPPGEYIIYKQPIDAFDATKGWKWRLENIKVLVESDIPLPGPGPGIKATYHNTTDNKTYTWNGTAWVDLTQLYLVDADPEIDSDNDHNYTNDPDAYNHALVEEDNAFGKEFAKKSVFRRTVVIDYMDNDGDAPIAADLTPYNRMRIRSNVIWQEGKFEFKTDLATTLTDYQGRENLGN